MPIRYRELPPPDDPGYRHALQREIEIVENLCNGATELTKYGEPRKRSASVMRRRRFVLQELKRLWFQMEHPLEPFPPELCEQIDGEVRSSDDFDPLRRHWGKGS